MRFIVQEHFLMQRPKLSWFCFLASLILLLHSAHTLRANEAVCLADLRSVVVSTENDTPVMNVRIVQAFRSPSGKVVDVPMLELRSDAISPEVRWAGGSANDVRAELSGDWFSGSWNIFEWKSVETLSAGDECQLPRIAGDQHLVIDVKYRLREEFATGVWWASYVASSASPGTRRVFVLRTPAGEEVVHSELGEWFFSRSAEADGGVTLRWESDAASATTVPWILAGSRMSWQEIGGHMVDMLGSRGVSRRQEAGVLDPTPVDIGRNRIDAVMSRFSGFRREASTEGFRAKAPERTLKERAGNCKDLSLVLLRALTAQGIAPYAVFRASSLRSLQATIPCPYVFDHVQVAVPTRVGVWILDPYAGRWEFQSGRSLAGSVALIENRVLVAWEPNTRVATSMAVISD